MARADYRLERGYENCQKRIYDGEGEYNIPVIEPVNYIPNLDGWIEYNKAATARRRDNKGCHFFIHDYLFSRVWEQPACVRLISRHIRTFRKLYRCSTITASIGWDGIGKSMG